jgi:transcriptional regulator with XRE-family HTH domain
MRKNLKEIVAEQLKTLMRNSVSLDTQEKLAKKTGVGQSTISRYLRGEGNPTSDNLNKIADAFNVPVGYFHGEPGLVPKVPSDDAVSAAEIAEMIRLYSDYDRETQINILEMMRSTARASAGAGSLAADNEAKR